MISDRNNGQLIWRRLHMSQYVQSVIPQKLLEVGLFRTGVAEIHENTSRIQHALFSES
jgi:hypothetical protein